MRGWEERTQHPPPAMLADRRTTIPATKRTQPFPQPTGATDLHLYQLFAPYGALHSVRVYTEASTGLCRQEGWRWPGPQNPQVEGSQLLGCGCWKLSDVQGCSVSPHSS
jgi:hypothetical protein